jgi:hypothetical protein
MASQQLNTWVPVRTPNHHIETRTGALIVMASATLHRAQPIMHRFA